VPRWSDNPNYNYLKNKRLEFAADVNTFGKQYFASNFSRGGFAATAFAATPGEAFRSAFRNNVEYGGDIHLARMKAMAQADPSLLESNAWKNQFRKVYGANRYGQRGFSKAASGFSGVLGKALPIGFFALPAFTTPGGLEEKARATLGGAASYIGWELGSKFGMGTGAAIGSIIPGFGTAIGAGVGYIVGGFAGAIGFDEGTQALTRIPDAMVKRERERRRLDWVGSKNAFQTQSAATMRQQSMLAMSRGLMNARSALGREAVMMHR
jgi:hypothetical protein